MFIDEKLEAAILEIIKQRLGDEIGTTISIDSIEVFESKSEIRIVVQIETAANSGELADRYFGLTGRVRDVLGDRWADFFPIITPKFGSSAHA